MEWLVRMQFAPPPGTTAETINQHRQAEAVRAAELAQSGNLHRLFRIPGQWANWGIWSAADATELHDILTSLPLYTWAICDVHPLAKHPNDPPQEHGRKGED